MHEHMAIEAENRLKRDIQYPSGGTCCLELNLMAEVII